MTERHRLDQLARWQRKIAEDPAVQAVIGPEQVAKRTAPLKNTGNELRTSNEKGGELYELNRLGPGLDRAANGVSQIRSGLARAAAGAGLLGEGSGNAEEGALQIADGLGASDRRRRRGGNGASARSTTARETSKKGQRKSPKARNRSRH